MKKRLKELKEQLERLEMEVGTSPENLRDTVSSIANILAEVIEYIS